MLYFQCLQTPTLLYKYKDEYNYIFGNSGRERQGPNAPGPQGQRGFTSTNNSSSGGGAHKVKTAVILQDSFLDSEIFLLTSLAGGLVFLFCCAAS